MVVRVRPLHPHLGAEITGVDLREPVAPEDFAAIEAAFNRHAVLVFPGQPLTDEQQIVFSRRFGPLETSPNMPAAKKSRLRTARSPTSPISIRRPRHVRARTSRCCSTAAISSGTPTARSSTCRRGARCCRRARSRRSGGETEFADLRAAYDALPEAKKRALEGLVVEHSIFRSRSLIGFTDFNEEIRRELPPVTQVLVRRHRRLGAEDALPRLARLAHRRLAGRGGARAHRGADRLRDPAGVRLPASLARRRSGHLGQSLHHASRPPYDDTKYRRDMHRTTVSDEINSVERERGHTARASFDMRPAGASSR